MGPRQAEVKYGRAVDPVTIGLLLFAGLILVGALGETAFARTQIPDVVWLIAAGALLGPVLGVVAPADLASVTPAFAAVTLIIVLFEGGSRLVIGDLVRAAPPRSAWPASSRRSSESRW